MGRTASPAALARTLSLQRANARAKSCRAESCSDKKAGTQLSKRIDALLTGISSTANATETCIEDTQINALHPCKQADDGSPSAIKRSFSEDISSQYKACFSSLSERIDRGLDLWDREFSSMSSYASDQDGAICRLQRRLNSGSLVCDSKAKEDACSKSSWSEESLADALEMKEEAPSSDHALEMKEEAPSSDHALEMDEEAATSNGFRSSCLDINTDCRSGSYFHHVANHKLQGDDRPYNLQGFGNHKLQAKEVNYVSAKSVDKGRITHVIDGDLTRGGLPSGACSHRLQNASEDGAKKTISEGNYSIEQEGIGIINSDRRSRGAGNGDLIQGSHGSCNGGLIQGSHGSCRISRRAKCSKEDDNIDNIRRVEEKATELPPNSVAVEKVSVNPVEDFRESMYEMMMEKDMEEESGDMEDLLDCYLLLNPSELHDVIREVFSHVWIDIIMAIR